MELYTVNTGNFKLDGGAMFGVVPKSIWHALNPADGNNMCSWAMRCMLVQDGDRLILIDNGMGDKQSEKFFGYYYLHGDDTLEKSMQMHGFHADDVTDVLLTHLHFDHCGGSVKWDESKSRLKPVFKNATYWSNKSHWDWAINPNAREKASFLKENIIPIEESGQLKFLNDGDLLIPGLTVKLVHGHTEAMMIPLISYKGNTVAFMADLLPGAMHIPLPYIMAYDVRPLVTLDEKAKFLDEAVNKNYILFFEHDPVTECCNLQKTDKGVRMDQNFNLSTL